jgi:hypothetical protein
MCTLIYIIAARLLNRASDSDVQLAVLVFGSG